jgi:hypothetical protein
MSNRVPAKKYWMGEVMDREDFGQLIVNVFYDGKTKMGPWAIMSEASWQRKGIGRTGIGFGQKYEKQEDGKWLKVE